MLDLDLIRIDGGTQARVELNQSVVEEYAEAFAAGAQFPPVVVYFDGTDRWLADGFHRYFGAKKAGQAQIYENVVPGTRRDAILHSLKANATHGLKRSNADKRKAVETMLADEEWRSWSDRKIAEACGVSDKTVASCRVAIFGISEDAPTARTVERSGKVFTQDTSNIGKADRHRGKPKKVPAKKWIDAEIKAADATKRVAELEQENSELREREPAAEIAPDYTELDQAHDQIADLQAALALANLGNVSEEDRLQAATLIADLQADLKAVRAELVAVKSTRDFLMEENTQMKRQMAAQRREIERLKAGQPA